MYATNLTRVYSTKPTFCPLGTELSEQQYGTNETAYSPGEPAPPVEGAVPSTPSPTTPATPLDCIAYAQADQHQPDHDSYPQVIRASDRDFLLFNHEVNPLLSNVTALLISDSITSACATDSDVFI